MANPTSGILDNYNLRFNWGTDVLEMNIGGEEWIEVPGFGGSPAGDDKQIQFNNNGAFGGNEAMSWNGTDLRIGDPTFSVSPTGTLSAIGQLDLYDPDTSNEVNFFVGDLGDSYIAGENMTLRIGTSSGHVTSPSAKLQIDSTTKGFLPPRMTTAQRDQIGTAASGTIIVNDYMGLGGKTVTIAGHVLTEGMEWTAAISNDDTATSLASAIDGLTEVTASALADTVTILGASVVGSGTITVATNDGVNLTISGATLVGEVDPEEGLMLYNAETHAVNFFNGTIWKAVAGA